MKCFLFDYKKSGTGVPWQTKKESGLKKLLVFQSTFLFGAIFYSLVFKEAFLLIGG